MSDVGETYFWGAGLQNSLTISGGYDDQVSQMAQKQLLLNIRLSFAIKAK